MPTPWVSMPPVFGPDSEMLLIREGAMMIIMDRLSDKPDFHIKCIKELRAKAESFEETGLILTLDASALVVKSDNLVDNPLRDALRTAFANLKGEEKENRDWYPRTQDMAHDLVNSSLYPLVYGRTRVLADEVVGVEDAIDKWAGKGEIIPQVELYNETRPCSEDRLPMSFWSNSYQWLPSNVKFQK
ncbi:hypothetical protein FZEAL_7523 [Fusarium zealandicum]|uniref:DUF4246 domain-containing protein n=1 Tax=Fusarium zealandicum TaxID=1053134 RepID=A0A8H4UGE0_9HYPO|nr:hypothetical protein FZEAL_7523 [Fusarium zealandicum]